MKKKITLTLLALVCALFCALGLAACNNGDDGDNKQAQTVAVTTVTLNKTELTLEIGGEKTLTATVAPDNATDKTVTWSSSAPTIATVANGKVTAVAEGTATITATTANNKTATCTVTVNAPTPTTKVTAEQWKSALSQVQNFTMDLVVGKIEYDGICLSLPTDGMNNTIFTKDNDNYYVYIFEDSAYVRTVITSDDYTQTINVTLAAYAPYITMYADDYSSFSYANDKYTCEELTKTLFEYETVIKNIEITFANGELASIKFLFDGETKQTEIKNIGTTTIEIPTNYTENND